jgi:glutamate dehydrogenase
MAATASDHSATLGSAQDFADALFATALPGEADAIDDAAVARIIAMVAEAAALRMPGAPAIAIDPIDGLTGKRRLALAIINDDMPFLVDSVSAAITAAGLGIDRLLHPVVDVKRTARGRLETLAPAEGSAPPPGCIRESMIYIELERVGAKARAALVERLRSVLADVRCAVGDWQAMLGALRDATRALTENPPPVAPHAAAETTAFLDWLAADNFTLLGVRRIDLATGSTTGMGLLREADFSVWGQDDARPALESPEPVIVSKTAAQSTVHRAVNFDMISVKGYDRDGRTISETRFIGLFTSAALATSPRLVPLLRRKVAAVIDKLGFDPRGHTGKALVHVLEAFPREELFEVGPERLEVMALGLLSLLDRPRPKLFARVDAFGRFVSVLVYVPRDAYTGGVRERVGKMLTREFGGTLTRYEVELRAEGLARVHYIIATPDGAPEIDEAALDARLDAMVRGWEEAVETALSEIAGPVRAARLSLTHGKSFSTSYRSQYSATEAAADILALSRLDDAGGREVLLYRRPDDRPNALRLKVYRLGQIIALSDAVPVLENFGLRVIEEFPFDLDGGKHGWIHDFLLEVQGDGPAPALEAIRDRVETALRQVLLGVQENDAFNALVIGCGLDSETTGWLRAYFRYLRQTGIAYGLTTVVDALRRYPTLANDLVALFQARFALSVSDRGAVVAAASARIQDGLADVKAIDDDNILQLYRAVILATLRTNAFVPGHPEALAFKLDSRAVPNLPPPVPYREIWVYSPRVEGIHLRGGPIARGGLRWSDRRDDFRTEVLGLVKAQKVKNTVIVPTGAKGGFYPKQLPPIGNREAWQAEGVAAYSIFIRALLSLTDNLAVGGANIPPEDVICHDAPDPYLVVAADKGTATFSDTANAIALAHDDDSESGGRGFWLGDAFASGGQFGYDHKAMAITARGAWISVQRHFRELGVDIQTAAVRVAGVGDMSGDVFGNGMLLSKSMLLVAAFDHRHIFIDPEPDAAKAFAERERLFALPRSSWDDYNRKLISKGGGVFPRSQKSIPLSHEMRNALGVADEALSPNDLIIAILKAKVDLMWFGGIGTYVRATFESNVDVGDRANDAVRITGSQIGARVIGEGANLGVTQAGRIEYAEHGGRINTDFVDNSAGVDCSDNEVNIKIALGTEVAAGRLTLDDRNTLLVEMTDEVASLVLADNVMQTQALSVAERGGAAAVPGYIRLIQTLEASAAELNRGIEGLASDDVLTQRGRAGDGLERPELAVVMAYAKMAVYDALVASPVCDDPLLHADLHAAFPRQMAERFPDAIDEHRLRRELIATKLTNELINRCGLMLPFEVAEELGASLAEVAHAYVAGRDLFDFKALWAAIDTADVPGPVQLDLHIHAIEAMRTQITDLLRIGHAGGPSTLVDKLKPGIERLGTRVAQLLRPEPQAQIDWFAASLAKLGAPHDVAARLVRIHALDGAVGVGLLAADLGIDEAATAIGYTHLGEALGLDWAKGAALHLAPVDPWERLLKAGLVRDFEQLRFDLMRRVVAPGSDPVVAVNNWLAANSTRAGRVATLVARARSGMAVTTAMLAHLAGQARAVLAG